MARKRNDIRVFFCNQNDGFCRDVVKIDSTKTLDELYRLIGCRCVGHSVFVAEGVEYDLWYDDEFLFSEHPIASFLLGECAKGRCYPICGSWVVTKSDCEGRTIGLSVTDVRKLWQYTDINSIQLKIAYINKFF